MSLLKQTKMYLYIIVLFVNCCLGVCLAQNADHNHFKYWIYRDRLLKEFVVPGYTQQNGAGCYDQMSGYSIPASTITVNEGYDPVERAWGKRLLFGDGTEYLAWYIGVLATEYALLERDNLPSGRVVEELYYALEAFDRLDRMAEAFAPYSDNQFGCNVNGFFIRADVRLCKLPPSSAI